MSQDLSNATLFEVSWEVCNKVGGIYAWKPWLPLEKIIFFWGPTWAATPTSKRPTSPAGRSCARRPTGAT